MNKKILFGVSTTVMLLNSVTANSAALTIYDSNNSTPFVSLNSPYANQVIDYNNRVYKTNGTAGVKSNSVIGTTFASLVGGSNPTQAAVKLGEGMDPDLDSMAGECIQGQEDTPPSATSADISVDGSYTRYSFLKDFASSANGGGSWGAFSGSGSGSYARLTKEDRLSLVFMYKSSFKLGVKSLINYSVIPGNPFTTSADLKAFRNKCGDRFVKEIGLGGSLFYTVKLNFDNYFDRLTVKAAVKASFLGFSGGGSFSRTTQTISNKGSIQISVAQSGGNVALLGKALSTATGSPTSTSITCDFSDMAKCMAFVDSLAAYASSSFPAQLDANPNANVISTSYQQYRVAGVPTLPPPLNLTTNFFQDQVWLDRIETAGKLEDDVLTTSKAERLQVYFKAKTTKTALDTVNSTLVDESLGILRTRQLELETINTVCWSDPEICNRNIGLFKMRVLRNPYLYELQPEHLTALATKI